MKVVKTVIACATCLFFYGQGAQAEPNKVEISSAWLELGIELQKTPAHADIEAMANSREILASSEDRAVEALLDRLYPRLPNAAETIAAESMLQSLVTDSPPDGLAVVSGLMSLGLPIYRFLGDLGDGPSAATPIIADARKAIDESRRSDLQTLVRAANDMWDRFSKRAMLDSAKRNWVRLARPISRDESGGEPDPTEQVSIRFSARILCTLLCTDSIVDLELFERVTLEAARDNPRLVSELLYFLNRDYYRQRKGSGIDQNPLRHDFTDLGLTIAQSREVPYSVWKLALELVLSASPPSYVPEEEPFCPFEAPSRNVEYSLTEKVEESLINLLGSVAQPRRIDVLLILLRSDRTYQMAVDELLNELRRADDLESLMIATNFIFPRFREEALAVFSERLEAAETSQQSKILLLKWIIARETPECISAFVAPLLNSDEPVLRDVAEMSFLGDVFFPDSRRLKMISELQSLAESAPSEATRESAAALLSTWRSMIIDGCLKEFEAAIKKPKESREFEDYIHRRYLRLISEPLVACPPDKILPYFRQLLESGEPKADVALYGLLQQQSIFNVRALAETISERTLDSSDARAIVGKWTIKEPDDNPFIVQSETHPSPGIRVKLKKIMSDPSKVFPP